MSDVEHPFYTLEEEPTGDYRGLPTFVCPCGNSMFFLLTMFDEDTRLPGWYLTDGKCSKCGAIVTVPCPVDKNLEVEG